MQAKEEFLYIQYSSQVASYKPSSISTKSVKLKRKYLFTFRVLVWQISNFITVYILKLSAMKSLGK